jgi:hypothetical protein
MEFLKNGRTVDPAAWLILWKLGVLGDPVYRAKGFDLTPLSVLIERLGETYGLGHEVILYTASITFGGEPWIKQVPLGKLSKVALTASMTLCVPPGKSTKPDKSVYERLGMILPGAKGRGTKHRRISESSSPRANR